MSEEAGALPPCAGRTPPAQRQPSLISSAHSPKVDHIETGGKLRDETCGLNFGITVSQKLPKTGLPNFEVEFWDASIPETRNLILEIRNLIQEIRNLMPEIGKQATQ